MKLYKLCGLLAVIALTASVAAADGIDPTVIIRQVDPPPIAITDPNQTFSFTASAPIGGPVVTVLDAAFQNDTGVLLQQLTLILTGTDALGNPLAFSFGDNPGDGIFSGFTSTVDGNTTTLHFFGVDGNHTGLVSSVCGGIDNELEEGPSCIGPVYDIQFGILNAGDTLNGDTINGTGVVSPIATPEPTTLVLFSAGLAGIAALKKRRRPSPQA